MTRTRPLPSVALLGFVAVCGVYGAGVRLDRQQFADAIDARLSAWDVWLSILSDPYLLIYFAAPMLLGLSVSRARSQADATILIRHGSRTTWLIAQSLDGFVTVAVYVAALAVVGATAGIGLSWSNQWSGSSLSPDPSNNLLHTLSSASAWPAAMVFAQVMLLVCAGTLVVAAMSALYVWVQRDLLLVGVSGLAFVSLVISFKASWPLSEFVRPVNYVLGYHALQAAGTFGGFFVAMAVAFVVLISTNAALEHQPGHRSGGRAVPLPVAGYAGLVVFGLISVNVTYAGTVRDVFDGTVATYYGGTSEGAAFLPLLFSIIVMVGFGYLATVYVSERLSGRFYYELIRRGSPVRWATRVVARLAAAAVLCIIGLWIINALLYAIFARFTGGGQTDLAPTSLILHQFFVNGTLQLMVYVAAALVAIWSTGRVIAGLGVIGVAVVLTLPALNPGGFLPSGLAAMGIVTEGTSAVWHSTYVLGGWLIALSLAAYLLLRHQDPSFE